MAKMQLGPETPSGEYDIRGGEVIPLTEDGDKPNAVEQPLPVTAPAGDSTDSAIAKLQAQLEALTDHITKPMVLPPEALKEEAVPTFEKDTEVTASPTVLKDRRLDRPGNIQSSECSVVSSPGSNDFERYTTAIRDLLNTLGTIAGSTARPSDELSAIAAVAIRRHSTLIR